MTEQQDNICKFNQRGFCKFKESCLKRHENKVCKDLNECRNKKCQERHPQICKYFDKDKKCRHKEKCAYFHREETDAQQKLNEILAYALATQIKEVADMRNEIIELKIKVQNLENSNQAKHINKENNEQKNTSEEADDVQLKKTRKLHQCDMCEYTSENNITLIKHKNTKHTQVHLSDTDIVGTSVTGKQTFHCDQCNYSCQNKKSLKKHVSHNHEGLHQKSCMQCDECDKTFKTKTELKTHMESHHSQYQEIEEDTCECTEDFECDKCLTYWAQKSH